MILVTTGFRKSRPIIPSSNTSTTWLDGKMEGMFLIGQNSAVGAPNSRFQRKSMAKLKWFVIRDMVETEPASFWRDSAEIERGELKTEEIETEVFFFPAAGHAEKEGAFTNTQRLLQWREKAVDPPGDCRSDAWFIHQLALRLIAKARVSNDPIDEALRALDWWYPEDKQGEPKIEAVLAEINGWRTSPIAVAAGDDRGRPAELFSDAIAKEILIMARKSLISMN